MVLITGARGFVGQRLMKDMAGAVAAPSLRNVTEEDLLRIVEESGCDTIIHTAAVSDIAECARNPEESYQANVILPVRLAKAARGRKLICFSSDQVYSGMDSEGPYTEETVQGGNLYAREKIEMEQRVLEIDPSAVMLRAEWMYDMESPHGNYLKLILGAKEGVSFSSSDYRGVTYLREVSEAMPAVMRLPGGAYNFGSETDRSFYAVTRDFLRLIGKDIPLHDAPAGHNLWMDCGKARAFGVNFSTADEGLRRCAGDYGLIKA